MARNDTNTWWRITRLAGIPFCVHVVNLTFRSVRLHDNCRRGVQSTSETFFHIYETTMISSLQVPKDLTLPPGLGTASTTWLRALQLRTGNGGPHVWTRSLFARHNNRASMHLCHTLRFHRMRLHSMFNNSDPHKILTSPGLIILLEFYQQWPHHWLNSIQPPS